MNWIIFLLVGFVAGVLAKALMPGSREEPAGWALTTLLGIAGAFVGGFIGDALGIGASSVLGSILMAAVGAIVIIALLRLFTSSRRTV